MKLRQKVGVRAFITVVTSGLFAVMSAPFLYATDFTIQNGAAAARGNSQPLDLFGATGVFTTVSNVLLFIVGALSVVMLIVGGLRYTISGGNSTAVTAAKNTVLYAIVGLVVAVLAFSIIHFVLGTLLPTSGGIAPTTT